jgi:hypothetical protein
METHVQPDGKQKKSKSKTRMKKKELSTYMCCVIANLTAIDAVQKTASKVKIHMKIYKLALQLNNDWMIENLT